MKEEINEDDEHGSKERVIQKYFLLEWKLVKSLIDDIVCNGRVSDYSSVYKIRSIVAKYQEQAQLLEPYLESMVSSLMSVFESIAVENGKEYDEMFELIMPICIIIYSLITACGYKAIVKFFPHHVSDLELAVSLMDRFHGTKVLSSSCQESTGEMETKCVILLWLSMLVLVPFDLSSVDSSLVNTDGFNEDDPPPIVLTILKISKDYLSSAGPMRSMACILLSKLLTRPDMPKALASFISWTHEILFLTTYDLMDNFRLLGSIEALAAIFKVHVGSRGFLMDMVPTIWSGISKLVISNTAIQSPLLRKYLMKLSQRIGLCFVPYRSPSWHYVSVSSSLVKKVSTDTYDENDQVDVSTREEVQSFMCDEPMDVPEIIEAIIDILLSALKDKDTVVRWSAAKGIGRITSRLTSNFADEVLHAILELFSLHEGEGSWHGGCLALAELARRGLLLPVSLPTVVPVIVKALHYDIRKGPHSVGSHVRDAASYVCWAFGRAYCYTDMKSVLNELAPHLLTVACYDREVNCRRAAAAAFQENVGRQGSYPHGIDIVNYADYFSLASRVNSYLHVAGCIAQYDGYLRPFVDELLHNKIIHWDKGLRELAAEALSMLVKFDKDYFANTVLEELRPSILSSDLCTRHGATLATGQLVLTLYRHGYAISTEQHKSLAGVVPALEKERLYSGKGGEIMRAAVSRFVECISLAHLTLPENLKQGILDTINENLKHPNLKIQNAAVDALKHFSRIYPIFSDSGHSDLVLKYLVLLDDPIFSARRGSAMAIGVLPCEILTKSWKDVILKLCKSCAVEDNPNDRDAESRVNAVKGLVSVCETLTKGEAEGYIHISDDASLHVLIKTDVIKALLKALEDYSVDNRGDVGSWIREAAINGLETCAFLLSMKDLQSFQIKQQMPLKNFNVIFREERSDMLFGPEFALSLIGGLIKQAVEKMDKLRKAAANSIRRVLYNKSCFIPFIPYREKLEEIVPNSKDLKWEDPAFSFPRFIQLLQIGCYSRYVLSGLVVSIGGLQDSLRKASFSALEEYLNVSDTDDESLIKVRESMLCTDILWILLEYKMCDRVIVPTLKMIELLLAKKRLHLIEKGEHGDDFVTGMLASIKTEVKRSKNFRKLNTSITILEYLSSLSHPMNTNCFTLLLSFLGHPYPKIRRMCGEQVYLALLHNPTQVADDKIETALDLVAETEWDGHLRMTVCEIAQLCQLTAVDTAALLCFGGASAQIVTVDDENKSYSSLVGSAGY